MINGTEGGSTTRGPLQAVRSRGRPCRRRPIAVWRAVANCRRFHAGPSTAFLCSCGRGEETSIATGEPIPPNSVVTGIAGITVEISLMFVGTPPLKHLAAYSWKEEKYKLKFAKDSKVGSVIL